MKRHLYTFEDIAYLKLYYPHQSTEKTAKHLNVSISSIYNKANTLGLKKSDEYLKTTESGRIQPGEKISEATQFKKGNIPVNKGKKWHEFLSKTGLENCKKTSFKKGSLPHNTKTVGAISMRTCKNNKQYQFICIDLSKWIPLYHYKWIQHYGSIPDGKIITFKDGNTMNCTIDNLQAITRKENMLRNSIQRYPAELKQTIKLLSKLNKTIHGKEQNSRLA